MKNGRFKLVRRQSDNATQVGIGNALREAFGVQGDDREVARMMEMIEKLKQLEGGGNGVVEE